MNAKKKPCATQIESLEYPRQLKLWVEPPLDAATPLQDPLRPRIAFFSMDPVNFEDMAAALERLKLTAVQYHPKDAYSTDTLYKADIIDLDYWVPEIRKQAEFLRQLVREPRLRPQLVFGYSLEARRRITVLGQQLLLVPRFSLNAVRFILGIPYAKPGEKERDRPAA